MSKLYISDILTNVAIGTEITVRGWVRTKRSSKNVTFLNINDGTTIHNIQAVVEEGVVSEEVLARINTGACIAASGTIIESIGNQKVELKVKTIEIYGEADPDKFPIQPKRHSFEFLREKAHLRMRTATFSAIFRIRHAVAFAIHNFFNTRGFYYLHTPIITGSDAEGAGEMFRVTTLELENLPKQENGHVDFSQDFFGKETNLTVSGQLEGELGAMALSKIYTFGPTFRAENSNTARHLAEFWMIEPEVAFNDLEDNMNLAEDLLQYVIQYVLANCADDIEFLDKRFTEEEKQKPQNERSEMGLLEKLKFVLGNKFERITYTEAIEILKNAKKKFQFPVDWGTDLQSEHERYLVEKHFKKPVILIDYPEKIKAFYMKLNEDGKTVRAMDVLFPGIGEIVGGSQREDDYEKLKNRALQFGITEESIWWYLETRQFGTCPHAGFGLGFERLILFLTGMSNIRDVIPFPRTPKNAEF
ncbi:MAG TPA: asparagine--tRNA ligase [Chitinophagales bacterium]|nr:asparagine--tRNA ligase [Chitinophagales bacterium]HNL84312.1 asparagine--tRNA ligase [Chitinophagales bacterium]